MAVPGSVTGQVLGHYRILERIGAGGMGVVYRAHDQRLERDVALKVLPPGTLADDSARKRFRQEALAISRLNHPNIATVHDFDTQRGVDFLVTELVPGSTLDEMLAARPLPEKDVLQIGLQLAEGLDAAHRAGVIHRDLKPGNLRLTPEGRVKILDFGLAKRVDPADQTSLTQSRSESDGVAGTPAYMAPEQLKGGKVDTRADLWAAGVVLYELATGQRPFQGQTANALAAEIVYAAPPSPQRIQPKLSSRIADIILKCLEKDPENRYQSAKELVVDLRRLVSPSAATATSVAPPLRRQVGRKALATAGAVVLAIIAAATYLYFHRTPPGAVPTPITSLAVLPLANLSGDVNQEYFADGVTEALITELSRIRGLKVISRTSAMQYKDLKKPVPQIASELGVDAVMEGSVQREGDQVRISIQLIDAPADKSLWAEQYQREYRSILALQSEVARAVVQQIKITLTPQEQVRLRGAGTIVPEAHEAYLKGRFYWNKRTAEDLKKSLEYYQQAIDSDPNYASAYAGMADAYALLGFRGSLPPQEALTRGRDAALRAIDLDGTLAEPHASLAFIAQTRWDWASAEREYKRALDLNPGYAAGHNWYAGYLMYVGRFEEGISEASRARDLDPLSLPVNNALAGRLLVAGRVDEALQQLQKTLEMSPQFAPAHQTLGWVYLNKGKHQEAIQEFQRALQLSGGNDIDMMVDLGFAYAAAGNREEARKILEKLKKQHEQELVPSGAIGILYGALGEKDAAFAWLDKAFEEHDPELTYLNVPNRRFQPLRQDPRFQRLLRRVGLAAELP